MQRHGGEKENYNPVGQRVLTVWQGTRPYCQHPQIDGQGWLLEGHVRILLLELLKDFKQERSLSGQDFRKSVWLQYGGGIGGET